VFSRHHDRLRLALSPPPPPPSPRLATENDDNFQCFCWKSGDNAAEDEGGGLNARLQLHHEYKENCSNSLPSAEPGPWVLSSQSVQPVIPAERLAECNVCYPLPPGHSYLTPNCPFSFACLSGPRTRPTSRSLPTRRAAGRAGVWTLQDQLQSTNCDGSCQKPRTRSSQSQMYW